MPEFYVIRDCFSASMSKCRLKVSLVPLFRGGFHQATNPQPSGPSPGLLSLEPSPLADMGRKPPSWLTEHTSHSASLRPRQPEVLPTQELSSSLFLPSRRGHLGSPPPTNLLFCQPRRNAAHFRKGLFQPMKHSKKYLWLSRDRF